MHELPIPGYPGHAAREDGVIIGLRGSPLRSSPSQSGYQMVGVRDTSGRRVTKTVHRLVALAFLPCGASSIRPVVRHLNGNKSDNRPANLAWGTQRDNLRDAVLAGGPVGAPESLTVFEQIGLLWRWRVLDQPLPGLCKEYGITIRTAYKYWSKHRDTTS